MTLPHHHPGRCTRCGQRPEWCICEALPSCTTARSFVIVRHWKELARSSNSARVVELCVPDAVVLDWGARGQDFDDSLLRRPGSWLLFPSGNDHAGRPVPELAAHEGIPSPEPAHIVLVDGSWSQARKMARRIDALREMPRFTVSPGPAPMRRLREPPFPGAMATAEVVARCIELLDGREAAAPLREGFDLLVDAVCRARGRD